MLKHRTFIVILISLLVSIPVVASAATQRGIVPVPIKDQSGNQVGLYKESHALVMGASDYTEGWQDLESVPNEVNDLVTALEAQGFHVVKVMNPNSKTLEKSFKDFINQYGFDPDNRLLFFFSGHGHTRQVGNITKGYLVPTDAPIPDKDPKDFKNKALSMKQIITWAEGEIESKHALFLFDSCFSGTILSSRGKPPIPRPIKDSTNHPVRQFISAGSAGQLVPSQSVFVPYFIRALKGDGDLNRDGYVTGTELGLYLRDQIMGGETHQIPQVGKSFNPNFNEGDFVFSLLGREQMEQSVDSIIQERMKLEQKRLNLEEKRKRTAALQRMREEERKLEEEKRRFKEEQDRQASLSPSFGGDSSRNTGKLVRIMTQGTPLRAREKPDARSKVVRQIPSGSVVPVLQETKDWFQIEYPKGKKGWVSKKYVRLVDGQMAELSQGKRLIVIVEGVTLKKGPGTVFPIIARIQKGEEVSFVRRTNIEFNNRNWLLVKYKNRSGYIWEGVVKWNGKSHESGLDLLKELEQLAKLDASPGLVPDIETGEPAEKKQNSSESYDSIIEKFESFSVESEPVKVETSTARLDSSPKAAQTTYVGMIQKKIYKNWQTAESLSPREEKVIVSFFISPQGNIDKPFVKTSSGVENLDDLALRAVMDSAPFPKFPKELNKSNLHINIYFKYVPPNSEPELQLKMEERKTQKQSLKSSDYSDIMDHLGSLGSKHGIRKLDKP
jgi:TonB family protein